MEWEILEKEKLIDHLPWLYVEQQTVKTPHKTIHDYYYAERGDYVIIIAIEDKNILMVEQYRPIEKSKVLNLPMGFIDQGEEPTQAAKREFLEETGYQAEMKYLGTQYPLSSFLKTKATVFLAQNLKKVTHNLDAEEGLKLKKIRLEDLKTMLKTNKIKDMGTLSALTLATDTITK